MLFVPGPGLRPLALPCPYPGAFGMVPHPSLNGLNGDLGGASAYSSLHNLSPQMSAAAAVAAYGRSQVVRYSPISTHNKSHVHHLISVTQSSFIYTNYKVVGQCLSDIKIKSHVICHMLRHMLRSHG